MNFSIFKSAREILRAGIAGEHPPHVSEFSKSSGEIKHGVNQTYATVDPSFLHKRVPSVTAGHHGGETRICKKPGGYIPDDNPPPREQLHGQSAELVENVPGRRIQGIGMSLVRGNKKSPDERAAL